MPKSKKRAAAAAVVARKKKRRVDSSETKNNPFEVRVNRRKHDVLGQKIKSGRGLPGVARSRAVQKVRRSVEGSGCVLTASWTWRAYPEGYIPILPLVTLCCLHRGRRLYCWSTGLGTRQGS